MKFIKYTSIYIATLLFFSCNTNPTENIESIENIRLSKVAENNYIVVFKDIASRSNAITKHNIQAQPKHLFDHVFKGFAAPLNPVALDALSNNPNVLVVEKDLNNALPNEQKLPRGVNRIEADKSIIAKIDGNREDVNAKIAILDTGVDPDVEDINLVFSIDFTGQGTQDDIGHGTHVAGITGAIDNDIGIVGVAPGVEIYNIKVLGVSSGGWSNIIAGMEWVLINKDLIDVVNMSLGGRGYLESVHLAAKALTNAGVIVVVAAGNESDDIYGRDGIAYNEDDHMPASFSEVATISAMIEFDGIPGGLFSTSDDKFAKFFSNHSNSVIDGHPVISPGLAIDVAMPGVSVNSFWLGNIETKTGTSMAAPHYAGVMGLLRAEFGKPTDADGVYAFRQFIIDNAFPQEGWRLDGVTDDRDTHLEGMGSANTNTDGSGNMWPVVKIISPVKNQSYLFGESILFDVSAIDPEDGQLASNVIWTSDIDGIVGMGTGFNIVAGTGISKGIHRLQALVADQQGFEGSRIISIIIVDTINSFEPILDSIGNKNIDEGQELVFIVRAIDKDETVPSLTTSILPDRATFVDNLDSTGIFVWRPDFQQGGVYNITFYANDAVGDFIDSEIVNIVVNDLPSPTTYILSKQTSDLSGGVHFNHILSEIGELFDSSTNQNNRGDTANISFAFTEAGIPGNDNWPTAPIIVYYHSVGGGGLTWIDVSASRIDINGNEIETSSISNTEPVWFNKTFKFTIPAFDWGKGSIDDRLRINYRWTNFEGITGQGVRYGTGVGGFDPYSTPRDAKIITQIPRNVSTPGGCCVLAGDVNNDGVVDKSDRNFLNKYVRARKDAPPCLDQADVNGDGEINTLDITYLSNYLLHNGPSPVCGNIGS